jgi:hypothetical protein
MARQTERDRAENGHDEEVARYEKELLAYLQERIKPGLNRGSIPLLARSMAKEIARDELPERDPEEQAEGSEPSSDGDESPDLETALRELQKELGKEWILYFCVHGKNTWLTAEKDDASQRLEAPNAEVLTKAVKVLSEGGGRRARQ